MTELADSGAGHVPPGVAVVLVEAVVVLLPGEAGPGGCGAVRVAAVLPWQLRLKRESQSQTQGDSTQKLFHPKRP